MEFLEFLLQKEGDRSWLPLDSPEAEILEGRYRVMARCDRGNASVGIRITYLDLEAVPPRRRVHQVKRTTTERGLLAVMPFTPLRTGTWTIRCAAPVENHEKPAWHYTLQLQVLEENAHHEADFEPDFDPDVVRRTSSSHLSGDNRVPEEHPAVAVSSLPETPVVSPTTTPEAEPLLESLEAESNPDWNRSESVEADSIEADSVEGAPGMSPVDAHPSVASDVESDQNDVLQDPWAIAAQDDSTAQNETQSGVISLGGASLEDAPEHGQSEASETISRNIHTERSELEQPASDFLQPELDPEVDEEFQSPAANSSIKEPSTPEPSTPAQSDKTSLPIEWENLPPEMQQDMAQMFQAVDEMAADILASMSQQFESIFPSASASPPSAAHGLESPPPASPSAKPRPPESSVSHSPQSDPQRVVEPQPSQPSIPSSPSSGLSPASPVESRGSQPVAPIPRLELQLTQDAFSVERGTPVTVSGQICAVVSGRPQHSSQTQPSVSPLNVLLAIQLTDPQTGRVEAKVQQSLTLFTTDEASVPFEVTLNLAPTVQTHLLLGEAVLFLDERTTAEPSSHPADAPEQNAAEKDSVQLTLTSYAFVVTLEMDSLLGSIAQPSETLPAINPPLAFIEPDEEPALPTPIEQLPPRPLRVSDQPSLPPQLYEVVASPAVGDRPPLDLPSFVKSSTAIAPGLLSLAGLSHLAADSESQESEAQTSDIQSVESAESADSDSNSPYFESDQPDQPDPASPLETPQSEPFSDGGLDEEQDILDDPAFPESAFPESTAMESDQDDDEAFNPFADALLELERLPEVSESSREPQGDWFNEVESNEVENEASDRPSLNPQADAPRMPDESVDGAFESSSDDPFQLDSDELEAIATPPVPPTTVSPPGSPYSFTISPQEQTHEPHQAAEQRPSPPRSANSGIDQEVVLETNTNGGDRPQANPSAFDAETKDHQAAHGFSHDRDTVATIPVPQLQIAEDELIAGQPARISVILPELPIQVFVKLWVQDRQTRTLLDGPRWVADFVADGTGHAEARTHFTVPLGCVEVRIEAIAVDVLSQRESHKTGIDRSVVPPNLPALSLDEFN